METFFVIVNASTKVAEQYPDTTGLVTEAQKLQWIDDMLNAGGMNVNQELVASNEPTVRPSVEESLLEIVETRAYVNVAHPVYPTLKQWQITYSQPVPKAVEIQKLAVDLKENEANETAIPYQQRLKLTMQNQLIIMKYLSIYSAAQIDAISTTILTNKEKRKLKIFRRAAVKILDNSTVRDNKHAEIDLGTIPDLNADWNLDDFTETV
jgi:hypothetical protein